MHIIDPHLHLFNLQLGEYHWLKPENPPNWPRKKHIYKNYGQNHLTLNSPQQLQGFVHIEAGFDNQHPWRELEWLHSHCTLPFRTVAFADLTRSDFSKQLDKLMAYPSLAGIRHILDQQACELLSQTKVQQHLGMLADNGLSFDAQLDITHPWSLHALVKLLKALPTLSVILNHGGSPQLTRHQGFDKWKQALSKLRPYPQVAVKLSGWEMHNTNWQFSQLTPVISHCLDQLGNQRIMLASNFPLSNWSYDYASLWQGYQRTLPAPQIRPLCQQNASHWYGFDQGN